MPGCQKPRVNMTDAGENRPPGSPPHTVPQRVGPTGQPFPQPGPAGREACPNHTVRRPNGPTIRLRPGRTHTGRSGAGGTHRHRPIPIPLAQRKHRPRPAQPTPARPTPNGPTPARPIPARSTTVRLTPSRSASTLRPGHDRPRSGSQRVAGGRERSEHPRWAAPITVRHPSGVRQRDALGFRAGLGQPDAGCSARLAPRGRPAFGWRTHQIRSRSFFEWGLPLLGCHDAGRPQASLGNERPLSGPFASDLRLLKLCH